MKDNHITRSSTKLETSGGGSSLTSGLFFVSNLFVFISYEEDRCSCLSGLACLLVVLTCLHRAAEVQRSAVLVTTDLPLLYIQSETSCSVFGLCITKKFETKKRPEVREDPPPEVSNFVEDLVI